MTENPTHAIPETWELLAAGFTADVWSVGDGRAIKLFRPWVSQRHVEREFRSTRIVRAAGFRAPEVFGIADFAGRRGMVMERIHGVSLLRHVQRQPWKLFMAARLLAELHARLHAVETLAVAELPTQREWLAEGIGCSTVLDRSQKDAALRALSDLPDGTAICHGDLHPENIFLTCDGPVILDWEGATRGCPLGDIACTSRLMRDANLPASTPRYMHLLMAASRRLLRNAFLWHSLRLHQGTRADIERWEMPITAAATAWRIPAE